MLRCNGVTTNRTMPHHMLFTKRMIHCNERCCRPRHALRRHALRRHAFNENVHSPAVYRVKRMLETKSVKRMLETKSVKRMLETKSVRWKLDVKEITSDTKCTTMCNAFNLNALHVIVRLVNS